MSKRNGNVHQKMSNNIDNFENIENIENNTFIGVDEAGRGPCIGRVYAGAVWWTLPDGVEIPSIITDSKKLSAKQRQKAKEWILAHFLSWGIGFAEASEIDEINILQATRLAMSRAISDLQTRFPESKNIKHLMIDGVRWDDKFGDDYNVTSVIGGDGKILAISAASILAKEAHDDHIRELCKTHPDWAQKYGLLTNMGYATKKHIEGLNLFGPCEQHRRSFHIRGVIANIPNTDQPYQTNPAVQEEEKTQALSEESNVQAQVDHKAHQGL